MEPSLTSWWAEWATVHWFLAFVLIMTGLILATAMCSYVVRWPLIFISRVIRHLNIRKAGWPPAHLDADGDWKEETSS